MPANPPAAVATPPPKHIKVTSREKARCPPTTREIAERPVGPNDLEIINDGQ